MAEWQDNELSGYDNIFYIVSAHADGNADSVEAEEILQWQQVRGFEADLLVLDNGRVVMDQYIDANPGQNFTQSVSVIFDQEMRIRDLDGTYVEDDDSDLQLLIDLASQ